MGADKLWLKVGDRPLFSWTLESVAAAELTDVLVIVAPKERWQEIEALQKVVGSNAQELRLCEGGDRRQDSVACGLKECSDVENVIVHDAARPLCSIEVWHRVTESMGEHSIITTAVPASDTLKLVDGQRVISTLDRSNIVFTQTPQAFPYEILVQAHETAQENKFAVDDDCALVEQLGHKVHTVLGDPQNFKVTTNYDWQIFQFLVND